MIYFYIVSSAVCMLALNNFYDIFHRSYSWWLIPVMFIGIVLVLVIIQLLIFGAMILCTNVKKERKRSSTVFRAMAKISLPIIAAAARVKIHAEGTEKLPTDTRFMMVCNHQHDFDPVIMYLTFPDAKLAFIGKKEIYTTMPFIAKAMHKLDCMPIDRENDRQAALTIIKAIKTIKEDRASIAIFPEGYTSVSCELLPFRNGCFKIATKSGCPIAVCTINNTREIPKNIFRRKTVVEFRLLDVIYPEEFKDMNTAEIGNKIHKIMQESLEELKSISEKS